MRQGEVDVQLFEPFAEELIAAGEGHLSYAVAARAPTAYTSSYMRRRVLTPRRDDLKKLVRGLYRTHKWLHAQPPAVLVKAFIGSEFTGRLHTWSKVFTSARQRSYPRNVNNGGCALITA